MRKKLALFLATITLLTSLSACGRRQEILNQIESEKAAESATEESNVVTMGGGRETVAPSPDSDVPTDTQASNTPTTPTGSYPNNAGYRLTGGINKGGNGYYNDVSVDALMERYDGSYCLNRTGHWNTPFSIIYKVSVNHQSHFACYNKLTGNFTPVCPDPLCRHTECLWGKPIIHFEYVNDTHIYFSACDGPGDPILYRCDLNRNHVESLDLVFWDNIYYAEGDKVYMVMAQYKADEAADYVFAVLDCKTKKLTTIYDEKSVNIYAVTGGDTVWFQYEPYQGKLYKTDLNFSQIEEISDVQNYAFLAANERYLVIGAEGREDVTPDYLYDVETGRKIAMPEGMVEACPALDNRYMYYSKITSAEEVATSPLKEYFSWELPQNGWTYHASDWAGDGRIWRMNLETGEEEMCAEISYNGIPIWIRDIVADGDAFFIAYITYEGFLNYYNQDCGLYEFDYAKQYMYVDINNGTITLLDP